MEGTLASNPSLHIHRSAKCAVPVTPTYCACLQVCMIDPEPLGQNPRLRRSQQVAQDSPLATNAGKMLHVPCSYTSEAFTALQYHVCLVAT